MKNALVLLFSCLLAGLLLASGITQEVPIGGIAGKVTMRENGRPLDRALVVITPSAEDENVNGRNWNVRTRPNGTFTLPDVPAGDYRVEVDAHEHSLSDKVVSVVEGKRTDLDVRLAPNDPSLTVETGQQVIAPGAVVDLDAHGFVPQNSIAVTVYRVKMDRLASQGGISEALQPFGQDNASNNVKPQDVGLQVASFKDPIERKDAVGAFAKHIKLPALPEGIYFALCRAGSLSRALYLNVTRIALVTKTVGKSSLCFVTDIDSGRPIGGAKLLATSGNHFVPVGTTDPSGLATVPSHVSADSDEDDNSRKSVILAENAGSVASCDFNQGRSDDESDDDDGEKADPNVRIFTYSDRPIYRPGDTVQFKSIVRKAVGNDLRLPSAGIAKIRIFDEQENLLATQQLPISAHGTLHGSYSTSPEAPPGVYRIEVRAAGGSSRYYANFAAYRKPDYSIKVTPAQSRYSVGDTASATVECQYFFGGPVVGAKVRASIYRSPAWDSMYRSLDEDSNNDDYENETADSSDGDFSGGEYVQSVDAITDGAGRATISFPTIEGDDDPKDSQSFDYRYSVQATVDEAEGHSFEGSGSVLVTRGSYRLSAEADPYIVSVGQTANLVISTESFDAKPKPVPNRTVKVEIGRETWTRRTVVFEPTQTLSVSTNSNGVATIPLKLAEPQNLRVRLSTEDDRGRTIREETEVYVDGSDALDHSPQPKLAVRLDRKQYSIGQTTKVLIATSSPGGSALLTVQAENIKMTRVIPLVKGANVFSIPVDKSMSPNVWVSVAYVHARQYTEATRRLTVKRTDKQLTVEVKPDTAKALPGAKVVFHVKTTDSTGRGVPADVSLGVVDESIYAIRKDDTDILHSLFPERPNLVETAYSFPEVYLDGGDKAGGSVAVRRKFLDTASWNPTVRTNEQGVAMVPVTLPDNLTSWRATVVAATDDSAVGQGTSNVVASKPLMVRLLTPQFLVASDKQQISAAITNDSGSPLDLDFNVRSTGVGVTDSTPKRLHLDQGQTSDVPLDLTAQASGAASLVAEVRSDRGVSDAVEGKFPVRPHGRLAVSRQSGPVDAASPAEWQFNVLPNRDPNTGYLELTVTPGVAAAMLQSLDQLVMYPYGCVEQTMSRFLPALLVTHTIKNTPLRRPDLEVKANRIAKDGFERLVKMQHSDGAWGWWVYDESDPFMTAWVLDGLHRAKAIGFAPPPNLNTHKAILWAIERLNKPFKDDSLEARLFLIYALAEYGKIDEAKAALVKEKLANAGSGELALAALAAGAVHDLPLQNESMKHLNALIDSDGLQPSQFNLWSTDECQALTLLALTELDPKSPRTPKLVHALMSDRSCEGWDSTRETSLVVTSLCNYLTAQPQAIAPSEVTVAVNGSVVKQVHVNPAVVDTPDFHVRIPIGKLAAGAGQLRVTASGGASYYSAELRQYDVEDKLPQILQETGVDVERRYYRMEPRTLENGTLQLLPSLLPVAEAQSGDVIRCEVTVRCSHAISFLMVEDPIPSNCRVTDREDPGEGEDWSYWWSSIVIRDDRVSMFARQMPAGVHKLTYTMRAEGIGQSSALPTLAEDMYNPAIYASGGESPMEVRQ